MEYVAEGGGLSREVLLVEVVVVHQLDQAHELFLRREDGLVLPDGLREVLVFLFVDHIILIIYYSL